MISFEDSLAILDNRLKGQRLDTESIPVAEAHNRILAKALNSELDLPPFDKSAMDGYAIRGDDERETYTIVEHIPAGVAPTRPLQPGEASRVMTGAPVPEGTGKVVMWEKTDNGMETVAVQDHSGKSNICKQGEDIRKGELLFPAGTKLTAVRLANVISCGVTRLCVYKPVRIAILATGDEIESSPDALAPGSIIDSNSPMLEALAHEMNLEVTSRRIVRDESEIHEEAILSAQKQAEIIILTGGVSEGDYDFVAGALANTGFTIHYDKVSVQPGKPLTFATHTDGTIAFGLPGNPVSVLNSFYLSVMRGVAHLSGQSPTAWTIRMPLAEPIRRHRANRTAFVPCKVNPDGTVQRIKYHGSGHLIALSRADGMVEIPLDICELRAGEHVTFYPLFQSF